MKTYTLTLGIFDRITIPQVLPDVAKYEIGIVVRDIRKKIEMTQEEIQHVNLRTERLDDQKSTIRWNTEKEKARAFTFTQLEFNTIRDNLHKMESDGKLPTNEMWLGFYEKIHNAKPNNEKDKAK